MVLKIEASSYRYCGKTDVVCPNREGERCSLLVVECAYKLKEPLEIKKPDE